MAEKAPLVGGAGAVFKLIEQDSRRGRPSTDEIEFGFRRFARFQKGGHAFSPLEKPRGPDGPCAVCNRVVDTICGKCRKQFYCGRECQKADWPVHKLFCAS
jgi:hypothetical protein